MPTHCQKNTGGWLNWFNKHDLGKVVLMIIKLNFSNYSYLFPFSQMNAKGIKKQFI